MTSFSPRAVKCSSIIAVAMSLCVWLSTHRSDAQTPRCSPRTIDHLESEAGNIRDWAKLRTFFHQYNACKIDDADIGEGISDAVAHLLAQHWETLPAAALLFQQDPPFEKFALAGLNATDSSDDLERIERLATENCPTSLHGLCQNIRRSIHDNK